MYSGIWAIVLTLAAVFGLPKLCKQFRRKERRSYNRTAAYKKKFRREMKDINRWREGTPQKMYKNPISRRLRKRKDRMT